MAERQLYACCICRKFSRASFRPVFRHIGQHRFDPNLIIACNLNSCTDVYKNVDSFRKHVYRKHREILCPGGDSEDVAFDNDAAENVQISSDIDIENSGQDIDPPSLFSKKTSALFLLKTREERKVTQSALNGIVQDMRSYWKEGMEQLQV